MFERTLKPLTAAIALALLLPATATAQELAEQSRAAQTDAAATPPSPFYAIDEVSQSDEKIQAFLQDRGWVQGESANNPAGGTLVVASADIAMDPTSIDFSQARLIATEEAFLQAMGELVSQDSVNIGKSMADRFMQNGLPEDVADTSNLADLGEALASRLAEASVQTLNKVIEELGGDASQLPQLNLAERKQLIYDEFVTDTTWRAMGELSGIGIFGVIEEVGGDGPVDNGRVSVVVVKSARFSEFGRQLRTGDVAPGQAIPVESIQARLAPQLEEGTPMLGYFGVQPIVDGEGRYGLLSFGMGAPALVRGSMDEFAISAELEAARTSAQMMADGWLAQFASMTVQGQKESTKRKLREQVRETRGDGSSRLLTEEGVGRMVNSVLRSEADAHLQGVQTVGQWNTSDPSTGHPYLGYVKYWSPGTSAKAQGLTARDDTAESASSNGTAPSTPASSRATGSFGEW
ncbi:DUF6844 domain-containing protein [Billgrantia gudaonensis]|uniref:DUF6844 domain-containing protein n=1 Tax=Billgrantia gudaonensis TaxID=376427 RepID=A0A1G8T023_9GAMM|nr:hypothetical protein [Halomonas gudaonensis]SDJ34869.1 hypothetical protein SAMN04487954_104154 [Halomonas gudaonensis]